MPTNSWSRRAAFLTVAVVALQLLAGLSAARDTAATASPGAPQTKAMVWPVAGRSPAFEPASVDEVLASYDSAFAVLATPAQLGHLRAQHFIVDPLPPGQARQGDRAQSSAARAESSAYHVIQFIAPPTPGWMKRLEDLGAWRPAGSALSSQSLVVRLAPEALDDVQALPFVESTTPFPSAGRLAPDIAALDPASWLNVSVMLFDPAAAPDVARLVAQAGGRLLSRDLPEGSLVISAHLRASAAAGLADHPEVRVVEPYLEPTLSNSVAAGITGVDAVYAALGYTGAGQTVAVADTGLDRGSLATMHPDFAGRIVAHFGYGRDLDGSVGIGADPSQVYPWSDPHGHGTHVAGSVLGDGTQSSGAIMGMAPDADLVMQSLYASSEDSVGGAAVGAFQLLGDAYGQGARIQTNSWGSFCGACPYSSRAAAYDDYLFDHPDLLVLFSAGNSGQDLDGNGLVDLRSLGDPAVAKNVLTVGAAENERPAVPLDWADWGWAAAPFATDGMADDPDGLAPFSSRGPTTDGRIKPDLVAPGTWILSTKSRLAPSSNYWAPYSTEYAYNGGTSMSTPITAGAAAVVREAFVDAGTANPSAALVKASLLNSATNLAPGQYGTGSTQELGGAPDFNQGWGRLDIESLLDPAAPLSTGYVDHTSGLSTGQVYDFPLALGDNSVGLQATLAWTDAAGAPGCNPCLVNDLDLVLVGPTGMTYRGNQFLQPIGTKNTDQLSATNPTGRDARNNVERIHLPAAALPGAYHLRVIGQSVPSGPQPFALVASAGFGDLVDLATTMTKSDASPVVGTAFDFVVTVTNNGPGDAPGVTLVDTLPAGLAYGTALPSSGTCSRVLAVVTCSLGPLVEGAQATVTIPVTASAAGTKTNVASAAVTGPAGDPTPLNDRASLTTSITLPSSDLAVTNTDDADPLFAGKPLTYTVTVTNNGPRTAPAVTLKDTLPAGMAYGTATASQGTCSRLATALTCLLGPMANAAVATVTIPMTPTVAATAATNTATASVTGGVDPTLANNKAVQTTRVLAPSTDLVVTNQDNTDPILAGKPLEYTVTVTNNGPDDAPGVTLKDTLPAGAVYGTLVTDHGSCARVTTTVTCILGPLASGEAATLTFPMTPTVAGLKTNTATATVTGGGVDPALANSRATQATLVNAPSNDIAVSMAESADPVFAGKPLEYTVTVTNNGPDDAPGVTLKDTLPSGPAYAAITTDHGTCTRVATAVTCLLGPLASGETATLTFPMTPAAAGTATNTATAVVTGGGIDPTAANNKAVQATTVRAPSSDLRVANDESGDPVTVGVPYSYLVTIVNDGPDDAPAVTLRDTLPTGVTYGAIAPSQGSCTRSLSAVTCNLGPMAASASATVTLTMTPTTTGQKTNTATVAVSGGGVDPALANNKAIQTTLVAS